MDHESKQGQGQGHGKKKKGTASGNGVPDDLPSDLKTKANAANDAAKQSVDKGIDLWKKIAGLPDSRIIRIATSDNFWAMGDTGPCGPCSEIFIDRGEHIWGGPPGSPEEDGDRFLEFWNLVFMQHEITDVKSKEDFTIVGDLPKQNIDTGMGLERIASILQGVDNLYEIDEVRPILSRAAEMTGKKYGAHSGHAASESHPDDVRLRVIADHAAAAIAAR